LKTRTIINNSFSENTNYIYSGHTDLTYLFDQPGFKIVDMRNIVDDSGKILLGDVYVDYSYFSGVTISGTTTLFQDDMLLDMLKVISFTYLGVETYVTMDYNDIETYIETDV